MEKILSFMDILKIYLDEGQVADFINSAGPNANAISFNNSINVLDPQFTVSRRIQIENLVTITEKELPKAKYADLFLYLSKQSINMGLYGLAEDILKILIKKLENIERMKDFLANAYYFLGEISFRQGSWKKAEISVMKAKKIFQSEKDRYGIYKCDNLIGAVFGEKGELDKALRNFKKALLNVNPKKEKYLYAMIESNIGILFLAIHNYDESFSFLQRALIYFEQINDLTRVSELKYNIANLDYFKKNYKEAVIKLDAAISAASKAENLTVLCLCFVTKADSLVNLGDLKMANAIINLAMEMSCKINDRLSIAEVYKIKGKIELEQNNLEFAENLLLTSLRLNRELENKYNLAETCNSLSKLYKSMKKSKESAKYHKLALLYWQEVNIKSN